jgi:hypothetical protein
MRFVPLLKNLLVMHMPNKIVASSSMGEMQFLLLPYS